MSTGICTVLVFGQWVLDDVLDSKFPSMILEFFGDLFNLLHVLFNGIMDFSLNINR